jgi:hypothetical protein
MQRECWLVNSAAGLYTLPPCGPSLAPNASGREEGATGETHRSHASAVCCPTPG